MTSNEIIALLIIAFVGLAMWTFVIKPARDRRKERLAKLRARGGTGSSGGKGSEDPTRYVEK